MPMHSRKYLFQVINPQAGIRDCRGPCCLENIPAFNTTNNNPAERGTAPQERLIGITLAWVPHQVMFVMPSYLFNYARPPVRFSNFGPKILDRSFGMKYSHTINKDKGRIRMGSIISSSVKVKITTSLDPELVKEIDEHVKGSEARSRSQLVENILRDWHREQKVREVENKIEQYYLSLSNDEKDEDRQWTKIAAESAKRLWEE